MRTSISLTSAGRALVALVGAAELFGQLYFGNFSATRSLIGAAALLLAGVHPAEHARVVLAAAGVAVLGTCAAAYEYYAQFDVPGNNFAWPLRVPFLLALTYLGIRAAQTISGYRGSDEG